MGLWSDESAGIDGFGSGASLRECYIEDTRVGIVWEMGRLIWVVDSDSIVKTV